MTKQDIGTMFGAGDVSTFLGLPAITEPTADLASVIVVTALLLGTQPTDQTRTNHHRS